MLTVDCQPADLGLLTGTQCHPGQDPRGAFDTATGGGDGVCGSDPEAAARAGHDALEALQRIDPARLDVSLPDGLALQAR